MLQRYIKIFYQKVKFYFFINYFLLIFAVIKYKIMTPKEKAVELVDKFRIISYGKYSNPTKNKAKQCALIAVELHLEELSKMKLIFSDREIHYNFWQEVKQELLKL
jgi:hypothetical protein